MRYAGCVVGVLMTGQCWHDRSWFGAYTCKKSARCSQKVEGIYRGYVECGGGSEGSIFLDSNWEVI